MSAWRSDGQVTADMAAARSAAAGRAAGAGGFDVDDDGGDLRPLTA